MKYLIFLFTFLLLPLIQTFGQVNDQLSAGPMLGYTEHREVLIWLEVSQDVKDVAIRYWPEENFEQKKVHEYEGTLDQKYNPVNIVLPNLKMGTTYQYEIHLSDEMNEQARQYSFSTRTLWEWRKPPPDFSFLFGSCAYINEEKYDRPGDEYGQDYQIFESMGNTDSDFMLWGGDNIYLREADWSSESGIYYRYHHTRQTEEMQKLLRSRPNYAIWDDHDYGPNNSSKTYPFKNVTLQAFKDYWGNQTYGEPNNQGIYSKIGWSDVDFFLLDNRYHRSHNYKDPFLPNGNPNPEKRQLGKKQLQWLKDRLMASRATFKVIVIGGQVLNPLSGYETLQDYPYEVNQLLGFIEKERIEGIMFLTGDRHFTELIKIEKDDHYPLYDFTCSPLTSAAPSSLGKEEDNPYRVDGTKVKKQNFARIGVSGEDDSRKLKIEVFNKEGAKLWEHQIKEEKLKF